MQNLQVKRGTNSGFSCSLRTSDCCSATALKVTVRLRPPTAPSGRNVAGIVFLPCSLCWMHEP